MKQLLFILALLIGTCFATHAKTIKLVPSALDSNGRLQTSGAIHRACDMHPNHAHRPLGIRHPLGHRQRDSKRSVPSGDRHNRGYPLHNRLIRLHPLVIHPLILPTAI